MTDQMQKCIDQCQDCHRICVQTISHCLGMGGKHVNARHLRVMLDCAQACATAADFMLRQSEFHMRTCGLCAELCAACADSCQDIGPHDVNMQRCVEICRACATSCRRMSGMAA